MVICESLTVCQRVLPDLALSCCPCTPIGEEVAVAFQQPSCANKVVSSSKGSDGVCAVFVMPAVPPVLALSVLC